MQPDTLRENVDPFSAFDLQAVVVGLALWLVVIIAALLVVLVLAVGLFSFELPVVVVLGVVRTGARAIAYCGAP